MADFSSILNQLLTFVIIPNANAKENVLETEPGSSLIFNKPENRDRYIDSTVTLEEKKRMEEIIKQNSFWTSPTIASFCRDLTNDFTSNRSLCTKSADPKEPEIPSICQNDASHLNFSDPSKLPEAKDSDTLFFNELGIEWLKNKKPSFASQAFCFALRDEPDNAIFYHNLALALTLFISPENNEILENNEVSENKEIKEEMNEVESMAIEALETAVSLNKTNPRLHIQLGDLKTQKANSLIEEYQANNDPELLQTAEDLYAESIQSYGAAIQYSRFFEDPNHAKKMLYLKIADIYIERAKKEEDEEEFLSAAVEALKNAVKIGQPKTNYKPNFLLAQTLSRLAELHASAVHSKETPEEKKESWKEILSYYKKAISTHHSPYRKDPEAKLRLAKAYAKIEDFKNARKYFIEVLSLDNKNAQAYYGLGQVAHKLHYRSESKHAFAHAIKYSLRKDTKALNPNTALRLISPTSERRG